MAARSVGKSADHSPGSEALGSWSSEHEGWLADAAHAPSIVPSATLVPEMRLFNGRFVLEKRLGQGGMGSVYAARDCQLDERVALKMLLSNTAEGLYLLKQEFRSLADVVHPNLVRLNELFTHDRGWFFTMELVEGRPLLRSGRQFEGDDIRAYFSQLADGVARIHAAGKLHRDLKPANVLLTSLGRVVILDFGLAIPTRAQVFRVPRAGTPDYMAPEQVAGEPGTLATDWYAFGVMLYQVLAGQLPFSGSSREVMHAKLAERAPSFAHETLQTHPGLCELCRKLLDRNPSARPTFSEIQSALGISRASPSVQDELDEDCTFIGREQEKAALHAALAQAASGATQVVLVAGASGMGKTALVEAFCASASNDSGALTLYGRCFERENVSFNAVDWAIDALSLHLRSLSRKEAVELTGGMELVTRLFPVLSRVPGLEGSVRERDSKGTTQAGDPADVRRQAFLSLAQLLARLAERTPLVLALDDFQWSDMDSVRLLIGLLAAPCRPALLLILAYRAEEESQAVALARLLEDLSKIGVEPQRVVLDRLSAGETEQLLRRSASSLSEKGRASIARESLGNPFFAERLARHWSQTDGEKTTLSEVLDSHINAQSYSAQRLLQALALSAGPVPRSVLREAIESAAEQSRAIAELHHARLLRTVDAGADPRLLLYHDRIREALQARLDEAESMELHRRLALAWQRSPHRSADVLLSHLIGAGQHAAAAPWAREAARTAEEDLAFERAAELYELARGLAQHRARDRVELWAGQGRALGAAGYALRSADAYLQAAAESELNERSALRWAATEQLLFSQNTEAAIRLLSETLPENGVSWPRERWRGARVALGVLRVATSLPRMRVLPFERRDPDVIRKFDACHAAFRGLTLNETTLATHFALECYHLGKKSGEPGRLAFALGARAAIRVLLFGARRSSVVKVAERAVGFLNQCEEPPVRAAGELALGELWLMLGIPNRAGATFMRARDALRALPGGSPHLAQTAQILATFSKIIAGDYHVARTWLVDDVERAEARGHRQARRDGRFYLAQLALVSDDVVRARAHMIQARNEVVPSAPGLFELIEIWFDGLVDRYAGDVWSALERHQKGDQTGRQSQAWSTAAAPLLVGLGISALACAAQAPQQAVELHRLAQRAARELRRQRSMVYLTPHADVIEAGVAVRRRRYARALRLLTRAEVAFGEFGMVVHVAMVRRQRGRILGSVQGHSLVQEATAVLHSHGVVDAEAFSRAMIGDVFGSLTAHS